MSVVSMSAVCFPFAVETSFPVPEAISNGMMITLGLLWGFVQGILGSILQTRSPYYPLAFWVCNALIAFICSFFVKDELRRLQMDEVKNSEYIEEEEVRR